VPCVRSVTRVLHTCFVSPHDSARTAASTTAAFDRSQTDRTGPSSHDGSSRGMHSGMRATVTIRDDLFEAADRVAERLGISRSRLYQTALEAYLRRLEEDVLTEQMNAAL